MDNLTCSRCGKTFEKTSTYKRHGYYCRSKKPGQTTSRKRSCTSCSQSKTRCDWKLPRCTNCKAKDIECQYTNGALQNLLATTSSISEDVDRSDETGSLALSNSNSGNPNQGSPSEFDSILWPDFSFAPNANEDVSTMCTFSTKDSLPRATFPDILDLGDPSLTAASYIFPPSSSYTLQYPLDSSSRCIIRRRLVKPQVHTQATLIIQILASFPAMMLRKETFPPFIHPRSFSTIPGKEHVMPEALVNCMSLAQLFKMRTKENSRFLWKSIRMEHERLWREYPTFDDFELLASAQAILIYILMRMEDGETEDNNFDVQLLLSLENTAHALTDRMDLVTSKYSPGEEHFSWHDWIFHESRRRIVIVARLMDMLVHMDYAICCQPIPGFTLVPLPAKKALWEARSVEEWKSEFDFALLSREIYGMTTDGKLMKLQQEYRQIITQPAEWNNWCESSSQKFGRITTQPADWNEWFASSDRFGTLIMLAASLH